MESFGGPLMKRFWDKTIKRENGCIEWTACSNGYGRFRIDRRTEYAHIVAWKLHHGSWPSLFVCHSCDNPLCVNIERLFEGTAKENSEDAKAKGRPLGRPDTFSLMERNMIREFINTTKLTQRRVAGIFGVSKATISEITRFKHEPRV